MARDFNQNRNTNAKLGQATIDKLGTIFAVQYGLDGFSAVNNVVQPMPTDIKEYLEGNDNITIFACASNIDKLCKYALASFPSVEDLYLFKTSAIVTLEDNLDYLLDLDKIYVPSDLLSAYIRAYQTLSSKFDTIVEDYTLTIPFVGDTRLTSEYVDSVIAMLSNAEKNAITKVVIPTDFSEASANDIAWGYDFSAIVNLDDNIWYGATQYDFSVWTITGSGTLTSAIVESSIGSIPSDKVSGINKVIIDNQFTDVKALYYYGLLDILPNLTQFEIFNTLQDAKDLVQGYIFFEGDNQFALKYNRRNIDYEYSLDNITWVSMPSNTNVNSQLSSNGKYRIYLRGMNDSLSGNYGGQWLVIVNNTASCYGNLESLCNYQENASGIPLSKTLTAEKVRELFKGCTNLIKAPTIYTMGSNGYIGMFNGTSITEPPILPRLEVCPQYTFAEMFANCQYLNKVPRIYFNSTTGSSTYILSKLFNNCPLIKFSQTQVDEYQNPYRVPDSGNATGYNSDNIFYGTAGTYTGGATLNTTYYTSNEVIG